MTGCDEGPGGAYPPPDPLQPDLGDLPPLPETPDNPLTVQGVELGRRLFHDPILSADSTLSCAGCHAQRTGFADSDPFSEGVTGDFGPRNAPAMVNAAYSPELFWDGRSVSLEDQARSPVADALEMNLPWDQAVARISAHPDYPDLFGRAFGTIVVSEDRVVMAIAQFERTLVSHDSRYDREVHEDTFSEAELRGEILFFSEQAGCFHCHGSLLFTDNRYHDIGLDLAPSDPGRMGVTGREADRGKFRSQTVRNVAVTAPYMHDGRFATLEEVLDHYATGVARSPNLDPLIAVVGPGLPLTPLERSDLVAFLRTLTDDGFLENPEFGPPAD